MNDKVFLTSKKIDWLVSLLMGRLMLKVIFLARCLLVSLVKRQRSHS